MKSVTLLTVGVALLTSSSSLPEAAAHHDTPAPQAQTELHTTVENVLRIDAGAAGFALEGHEGDYRTLAVAGRARVRGNWLARLRIPLHALSMDAEDRITGLGDISVGGYFAQPASWGSLLVGVDGVLPTGSRTEGLGAGSPALAPWAAVEVPVGGGVSFRGAGMIAANLVARAASNTTFIEHRSDLEARGQAGVGWRRGAARLLGEFILVAPMAPAEARGDLFPGVRGGIGLGVGDLDLGLSAEFPLGQTRRQNWSALFGIGYRWGTAPIFK